MASSPVHRTLRMNLLAVMIMMMVVVMMMVSVHGSSPQSSHENPSSDVKNQDHGAGHQKNYTKKAFPVLSFDYEKVEYYFIIFLWILLASLMKLGEFGFYSEAVYKLDFIPSEHSVLFRILVNLQKLDVKAEFRPSVIINFKKIIII